MNNVGAVPIGGGASEDMTFTICRGFSMVYFVKLEIHVAATAAASEPVRPCIGDSMKLLDLFASFGSSVGNMF